MVKVASRLTGLGLAATSNRIAWLPVPEVDFSVSQLGMPLISQLQRLSELGSQLGMTPAGFGHLGVVAKAFVLPEDITFALVESA